MSKSWQAGISCMLVAAVLLSQLCRPYPAAGQAQAATVAGSVAPGRIGNAPDGALGVQSAV